MIFICLLIKNTCSITPNQMASHIVSWSRAPKDKEHTTSIEQELSVIKATCRDKSNYLLPFTYAEVSNAL